MPKKKYTFIDLFAGCGGLSEGFLQTGRYKALAHIEWEKPMVDTLRNRLVEKWEHTPEDALKRVVLFDVQKTQELLHGNWSKETKIDYADYNANCVVEGGLDSYIKSDEVDLIIGGPPCQAYSIAGRAQSPTGMKDDYRNYLFESYVKIVDYYHPKTFVFENVPGLLSACPGDKPVRERIYEAFSAIGYEIRTPDKLHESVYCSVDFQAPQVRNRVIILGVKKGGDIEVEELYASLNAHKSKLPYKTVREAIGDLPKIYPLDKATKVGRENVSHAQIGGVLVDRHYARFHNERDIAVFKDWLTNDLNHSSQEAKLAYYTNVSGKKSHHIKYRSLEWDKPSPTIVAHLYKDGLMFIHPDVKQARSITIREAALLMGFPMDFHFLGSNALCFKMIGNAVPMPFAKGIAEAVYDVLKKK